MTMQLFVDKLTNVDFSFLDPKRGLLGETYWANIVLRGALDDQGMLCDFGTVKKRVRQWLDQELDHRLAVPIYAPQINLTEEDDYLRIRWQFGEHNEFIETRSPRSAIALVEAEVLTPATIADWCTEQLNKLFTEPGLKLDLSFSSEDDAGYYYHYSHGLKKHDGNCQRIAHGHRSRIDIWENGDKSSEWEQYWALRWRDIYIGTKSDIRAEAMHENQPYYHFAYGASQGVFELSIPQARCYLMETDTTVELIAQHIAQATKQLRPASSIRVKAFEGVHKGALTEL